MSDFTRTLGWLGLVAACGPTAPQSTAGDATSDATSDATGDPTSDPTSAGPGSDSDPTSPSTTTPPPECVDSDDCADVYCGYCSDGVCMEVTGCCGDYLGTTTRLGAPVRPDVQRWRCSDPPYGCYNDYECGADEECLNNECVPIPMPPPTLPACDDPGVIVSQWQLGVTPGAFVLADLDADGDLDLAAAQPSVARIELALNDGAGHFVLAGSFGVGGPTVSLALAAGDLDGDKDIDLVVARPEGQGGLILLFGQDAVFTAKPPLPIAPDTATLFIADLNNDAFQDIVAVDPQGVATRLGNKDADFSQSLAALEQPLDTRASLFDVDKDGRLDLVAGGPPGDSFNRLFVGVGEAAFVADFSFDNGAGEPSGSLAADLNLQPQDPADDLPAVIFTRSDAGLGVIDVWAGVDVFEKFASRVSFVTSLPITGAASLELAAPPGPDILAATGLPFMLVVQGDGVGGFACERVVPTNAPTVSALLAAGDLNGDGRVDLVVGDRDSPTVLVMLAPVP